MIISLTPETKISGISSQEKKHFVVFKISVQDSCFSQLHCFEQLHYLDVFTLLSCLCKTLHAAHKCANANESVSYYFSFGFYQCFNAKDVEDAFGSKTRDQVDEVNKELYQGPLMV